MTSSQGDNQNAKGGQSNDFLIAVGKSLNLDDRSSGQTCHPNAHEPSDKSYQKLRIHLHDDKELDSFAGVAAVERPIDVDEINRPSDDRHVVGRRLVRTVAFGVLTGVLVSAGFAWHFYGDAHSAYIVDNGRAPSALVSMKAPGSNVTVEQASKTSDRVPTQDQATLSTEDQAELPTQDQAAPATQDQAAPVLPPGQVSVAPGSSPELQDQLESIASDVAVVRRIVERLAAVQEQIALDVVTLQKSNQANQKASMLPHAAAGAVSSRQRASNIVRSTPSAPVPSTLFQTTAAPR
jgi:hypothetical protein